MASTQLNELLYSYLGSLGYTGSLQDRLHAWSKVDYGVSASAAPAPSLSGSTISQLDYKRGVAIGTDIDITGLWNGVVDSYSEGQGDPFPAGLVLNTTTGIISSSSIPTEATNSFELPVILPEATNTTGTTVYTTGITISVTGPELIEDSISGATLNLSTDVNAGTVYIVFASAGSDQPSDADIIAGTGTGVLASTSLAVASGSVAWDLSAHDGVPGIYFALQDAGSEGYSNVRSNDITPVIAASADPAIGNVTSDHSTADSTSYVPTLPTASSGDKIAIVVSKDGGGTMSPSTGWTTEVDELRNTAVRMAVYTRTLDGGGNDTLTVTSSDSQKFAHVAAQITDAGSFDFSTVNQATTTSMDFAAYTPPASRKLFMVFGTSDRGASTITGSISGYTGLVTESELTTSGPYAVFAYKEIPAGSASEEAADSLSLSALDEWLTCRASVADA